MNSVHDMGGMHGMGPIEYDKNEGAFHEPWEGRAWALISSAGAFSRGRRKNFRFELESIPAADYLRMSYYERLIKTMLDRLLAGKFITQAELDMANRIPVHRAAHRRSHLPWWKTCSGGAARYDATMFVCQRGSRMVNRSARATSTRSATLACLATFAASAAP
jgi:hypothetical protein